MDTFNLPTQELQFISSYSNLGFQTPEDLIMKALELLRQEINRQKLLAESADLYAEIYEEDTEGQEWVNSFTDENWD